MLSPAVPQLALPALIVCQRRSEMPSPSEFNKSAIVACDCTDPYSFFRDTKDTKIAGNLVCCVDWGEAREGIDGG